MEEDKMTREERIKKYAYEWWQFRVMNNRPGTPEKDFEKAEHIVDNEDRLAVIEADYKFRSQPSRMRC